MPRGRRSCCAIWPTCSIGPELRRGLADLDGEGEAVGGIIVMRFGENALKTIENVKHKLKELQAGLPEGVTIKTVYDRSGLIERAVDTLKEKLIEESIVVAVVTALFLFHLPSALVAIFTLPVAILMAFIIMHWPGDQRQHHEPGRDRHRHRGDDRRSDHHDRERPQAPRT